MLDAIYSAVLNKDAHLYEIDKEKLRRIYNITEKKKREYKVYERKIIYANTERSLIIDKYEMEKSYFSNYKFFRDYLLSGYESDDIKIELNEIRNILKTSKNLRENIQSQYKLGLIDETNLEHEDKPADDKKTGNKSDVEKRKAAQGKTKFLATKRIQKPGVIENFAKMCRLFTIKPPEEKREMKPVFKLFSELNTPTDAFSQTMNENHLKNKFLYYKKKLTKSYYLEEFMFEFAKNYYPSTKENQGPIVETLPKEIRQKFPIESLESTFRQRGNDAFHPIETFMTKYGISQKSHLYEKDLYENIYDILSKCNYANFLSFLYSKNDLFKYLYNEFTIKNDLINPLEDTKISRIDSYDSEENTKGEFLSTYQKETKNRRISLRIGTNVEDYFGCYFLDKICFMNEKIDDKIVDYLLSKNNSPSNEDNNNIPTIHKNMINLLASASTREFQHIILITKNERLKITSNTAFSIDNQDLNKALSDIDEDCKKIKFYKIDKNSIPEILNIETNFSVINDIFSGLKVFYIIEIKIYNNKGRRNSTDPSRKPKYDSLINVYYLIRLNSENIDRFDIALNQLKILEHVENNKNTIRRGPLQKAENKIPDKEQKKINPSPLRKNYIYNYLARENVIHFEDDQAPKSKLERPRKQSKSEKELKKAIKQADTEEDFLDLPQDDNVLDMVFNEYVQKEE